MVVVVGGVKVYVYCGCGFVFVVVLLYLYEVEVVGCGGFDGGCFGVDVVVGGVCLN